MGLQELSKPTIRIWKPQPHKKDGLNRRTSLKPLVETTVAFRRHGVEPVAASVTSFSQICTKLHDLQLKM